MHCVCPWKILIRCKSAEQSCVMVTAALCHVLKHLVFVTAAEFDLGRLQNLHDSVDHVVLPPWAKSPYDFIFKHMQALVGSTLVCLSLVSIQTHTTLASNATYATQTSACICVKRKMQATHTTAVLDSYWLPACVPCVKIRQGLLTCLFFTLGMQASSQ